ncbi:hypothetical protein HZB93_04660 [Candidatus Falkowbacteria bacterium]|nr:hypothetical protein [Candidatus Falkowbacteria bacterium]
MDISVLLPLNFIFRGDKTTALAAVHYAGKGKDMAFGSRLAFTAKNDLYFVILFGGDHRLMYAFIPVAAALRILIDAVVDRIREKAINSATAEWLALPRFEFPFVGRNPPYLHRRMMAGKHEVKHSPDHSKSFRVSDDGFVALLSVGIVQIADRRDSRINPALRLFMKTAFHVAAEVAYILIRHSKLKIG